MVILSTESVVGKRKQVHALVIRCTVDTVKLRLMAFFITLIVLFTFGITVR